MAKIYCDFSKHEYIHVRVNMQQKSGLSQTWHPTHKHLKSQKAASLWVHILDALREATKQVEMKRIFIKINNLILSSIVNNTVIKPRNSPSNARKAGEVHILMGPGESLMWVHVQRQCNTLQAGRCWHVSIEGKNTFSSLVSMVTLVAQQQLILKMSYFATVYV